AKYKSTIVKKVLKDFNFESVNESREYVFNNYTVRYIQISDIEDAKELASYIIEELNTKFNNFY
ncbi:hypothetical protein, partial [Clostridium sp.]|uniref:hypothetical protein n=1 Tax=Clostridium sp. TaxID=1506 RepID=UPI003464B3D7